MASTRGVLAFVSLVSGFVLANGHVAGAEEPSLKEQIAARNANRFHVGADGRYRKTMCPTSPTGITCMSERIYPEGWAPGMPHPKPQAGAPTGGMTPTDIVNAYKIPAGASAGGKIVAILDSPDSHAFNDLTAYRNAYGITQMAKCTGLPTGSGTPCFAQVNETGGASSGTDSGGSDGETGLDMDMISAACPDCSILLVELDQLSDQDILTGAQTASTLKASATSISLGGPEQGGDPTGYTTPGHLVFAASGDFGYLLVNQQGGGTSPSYPSSAPDIISVGGTALYNNNGVYDEGIWNDLKFGTAAVDQDVTTSGCSTEFDMPAYQTKALAATTCTKRGTADVSAAATFFSGTTEQAINIYATLPAPDGAGFFPVEGTSASSPLLAALYVRVGISDAVSNDLSWEYTHPTGFNDLGSTAYPIDSAGTATDAKTTTKCANNALCVAMTGWDGPSGVGTPNGTALFALAGNTSTTDGGAGDSGVNEGGTGGDDSGTTGDDSGSIVPVGDDGGQQAFFDSGAPSGADGGGNGFGNSPPATGCSCNTPGGSSTPLEDTGLAVLAVGAFVAIGARRRNKR